MCNLACRLLATSLALSVTLAPLQADDRDLLRTSTGEPYVFIIFDTSGSMNWTPRCTQAQIDAGICSYLCPTGDCLPRRAADDPASKFRQAKEALHEVLSTTSGIQFGFATYNQDRLEVGQKHWLYRVTSNGPRLRNGTTDYGRFPTVGQEITFGPDWGCDRGNSDDAEAGCDGDDPADLNDAWEVERVLRHPKLGTNAISPTVNYIRTNNQRFRITWTVAAAASQYGNPVFTSRVTSERCNNSSCSTVFALDTETVDVTYALVGDFLNWENRISRTAPNNGWFGFDTSDHSAMGDAAQGEPTTGSCGGWDPNTDSGYPDATDQWDRRDDTNASRRYSLRFETTNRNDDREPADAPVPLFTKGDVLPLDWRDNHRSNILARFAPNGSDFTQASYFNDTRLAGENFLRLENEDFRPLIAQGSTPLGKAVRDFRIWYAGCPRGSCNRNSGWKDVAARLDPNWSCRRKFLVVVTDGDDTCPGEDACSYTASLRAQEDILTYVVAFGVENTSGNRLNCMAANGGTGDPIYPQNKAELVEALTRIFGEIQEVTRAFASAAVPSVQADVSDKIYISRFVPLNDEPIWPGSLDAYVKPLPLNADGSPVLGADSPDRICDGDTPSGCYLWDVGAVLFGQAPTPAQVAAGNLKISGAANARRVFYPQQYDPEAVPARLRPFVPPSGNPGSCPGYPALTGCDAWWDLFYGFGLDALANPAKAATEATRIIGETLVRKQATQDVVNPDGTTTPVTLDFVLGDLFHSDPLYVERPNDFDLFSTSETYRDFGEKHRFRRKMLAIGSNDGQIHFFDAGRYRSQFAGEVGEIDTGTGTELFSIVPRMTMPIVRDLSVGDQQIFAMDGPPRLGDVFIDPLHNGTPDPDDREWRTIVMVGMREGGNKFPSRSYTQPRPWKADDTAAYRGKQGYPISGYVAIDVTQPDRLRGNEPDDSLLPTCLRLDGTIPAGCGPLPFPAVLWEFRDENPENGLPFDEDQNGRADLADTWSAPVIRAIGVQVDGRLQRREVAFFGGGMDAPTRTGEAGNWIYMVDVETGRTIYKRRVTGAVAANITVQDRDNDGIMDHLYFGTTAGLVYKVDISLPGIVENIRARDIRGNTVEVERITDELWEPFPVFVTGPASAPPLNRPIYYSPTVFYESLTGGYAIAFGTGDREDLWSNTNTEGRFYVVLDRDWTREMYLSGILPIDESSLFRIDPRNDANAAAGTNYVIASDGWFYTLERNERVITPAIGLVGLLNFTSYNPVTQVLGDRDEVFCARTGESRLYLINALNGNGFLAGDTGPERFDTVADFATPPFLEQGQTANEGTTTTPPPDNYRTDVLEEIKNLFPEHTRFANYHYRLVQRTSRNNVLPPIIIPIGITISNWKEF